eukprot:jgi/Botrbrau1/17437/Bobra.0054s0028.1
MVHLQACTASGVSQAGGAASASEAAKAVLQLNDAEMAAQWQWHIREAERPILLSRRDGKLIKPVPAQIRLEGDELTACLKAVISQSLRKESQRLLYQAKAKQVAPGRASISLMRSFAYLHNKQPQQALKDARVALTYGPQKDGQSRWAWARAAEGAALEAMASNTLAALAFCQAVELDPKNPRHLADLERLLRRIPPDHAVAIQSGGSGALQRCLDEEAERSKPEFLKARPKYFYYYEWMQERIAQHCGPLPPCVLAKLLALDATELDLILTYPRAVKQQCSRLLEVLERKGG